MSGHPTPVGLSQPFQAAFAAAEYQAVTAAAVARILAEEMWPEDAALAVQMLGCLRERWDTDRAAVGVVADRLTAARGALGLGRAQYAPGVVAANAHLAALALSLRVQTEVETTIRVHTGQLDITPQAGFLRAVDLSLLPQCQEAVRWQIVDLAIPEVTALVADMRPEGLRADRDAGPIDWTRPASPSDLARAMGISRNTLRNHINAGKIPCIEHTSKSIQIPLAKLPADKREQFRPA
jgi:hypothetical protein